MSAKKNAFVRKLEEESERLLELYGKMLAAATIVSPDEMTINDQGETGLLPTQTERENAQLHVYAEHMVQVAQELFTVITELKHNAVVSEGQSLVELAAPYHRDSSSRTTAIEADLVLLQNDVRDMVMELESAYYASPYR